VTRRGPEILNKLLTQVKIKLGFWFDVSVHGTYSP
jgi:hypothetical protein